MAISDQPLRTIETSHYHTYANHNIFSCCTTPQDKSDLATTRQKAWKMQSSQICTAIVPECPFPYENPIDLQFPLHFDDSAELCSLRTENGDDPREVAERLVEDDFVALVENFDKPFDGGIRMCFAITGAARAANPFHPRGTELFFNVEMTSTDDAAHIQVLHPRIMDIINKHFEGVSGVRRIIRYTLGGFIDY